MDSAELQSRLKDGNAVSIGNLIQISKHPVTGRYSIRFIDKVPETKSIVMIDELPTEEEIQLYINAFETIQEWKNGYSSVGEWELQMVSGNPKWKTENEEHIRIKTEQHPHVTSTKFGEMAADEFVETSLNKEKVELKAAIFLNKVSPREFEYLCSKYQSMYQQLIQIENLNDNMVRDLLCRLNCETFRQVRKELGRSGVPLQYRDDIKYELRQLEENQSRQLINEEVVNEFSDVVVARNI